MPRPESELRTIEMLEKVPIFHGLSGDALRGLARDAKERIFSDGVTVVRQGEVGVGFYLVLEGHVEVRRSGRRLAVLGRGQFFGEMALFDEEPRTADVLAVQPTRCLVLTKWAFWRFAMSQPGVLRTILKEVAHRLRDTDQALSE
jgi:CRP-like cAMP-binding protein